MRAGITAVADLLVLACNSATAVAIDALRREQRDSGKVIGSDQDFAVELLEQEGVSVVFGAAGEPVTAAEPIEHVAAAALHWLQRERALAPELGCWSEAGSFTGWRLGVSTVAVAPLPSVVLSAGQAQWPVRCSAPATDGTVQLLLAERGGVDVDCEFCNQHYHYDRAAVQRLLAGMGSGPLH